MSKRLITDRDVLEGRCGARIVLDGETLLTPSARDRAMRLGIAIVEHGTHGMSGSHGSHGARDASAPGGDQARRADGARCGTAACSGQCARCATCQCAVSDAGPRAPDSGVRATAPTACGVCGGAATGLPDGLYLVRIEGGRAVSTLPAAGPGLMPRATPSHDFRS